MNKKILIFLTILLVLTMPSVLAFDSYDLEYMLYDLMDNEFVILGLVFVVLFAFIHFSLSRKIFKENIGACAVIALASSAIISFALYREGAIDWLMEWVAFSGKTLAIIGIIVVFLVILWAFVKFTKKSFKP